jgi:hypothetical protein
MDHSPAVSEPQQMNPPYLVCYMVVARNDVFVLITEFVYTHRQMVWHTDRQN